MNVVMFSGGVGSWMAAKRVAAQYGTEDLTLLFTDTMIEDPDLYRFLDEAAANVGGTLVKVADGRTPWDVFHDERMLGNARIAPCSKILKQNVARRWVKDHCPVESTTLYLGIDWTEEHRYVRSAKAWEPYLVLAPLCDPPYLDKGQMLDALAETGIEVPRLYKLGFPHNNCGGGCVRAGQAHFSLLLDKLPDVYANWEQNEEEMRQFLNRNVAILRDRSGGTSAPLTLREFRERKIANVCPIDRTEWGGCGCFSDDEERRERDEGLSVGADDRPAQA